MFGPARFSDRHDTLRTPVGIETVALLGLGFALSVAGIVAVVLVLRAEQRTHEREVVTLRALGFTRARLGLTSVLRSLPLVLGGALLTVGVAIALSGRYPVGIGRQVELDRGVQVDAGRSRCAAFIFRAGRPRTVGCAPVRHVRLNPCDGTQHVRRLG